MTDSPRSVEAGGVGTSPNVAARPETSNGLVIRSPRGLLGAIVLLLALPIAVLVQVLFGSGSATTIHFLLAIGSVLVSLSVFDFETPRWIAWIGSVATSGMAAIFLAQGASSLIENDSFSYFANQVLGNWPEKLLLTLVVFWFVALLIFASRGRTRTLGAFVMAIVVCVEAFGYGLQLIGTNMLAESPALRLLYLLPFVWLIFESRKSRPKTGS